MQQLVENAFSRASAQKAAIDQKIKIEKDPTELSKLKYISDALEGVLQRIQGTGKEGDSELDREGLRASVNKKSFHELDDRGRFVSRNVNPVTASGGISTRVPPGAARPAGASDVAAAQLLTGGGVAAGGPKLADFLGGDPDFLRAQAQIDEGMAAEQGISGNDCCSKLSKLIRIAEQGNTLLAREDNIPPIKISTTQTAKTTCQCCKST